MTEKIHINYSDFWPGFDKEKNYFVDLLSNHYDLVLSDRPNYLIHSVYGSKYKLYICKRICFIGENRRPNFSSDDYVFGFDYLDHDRYCRLPLYLMYDDVRRLIKKPGYAEMALSRERGFCSMVVSNANCAERNEFYRRLSCYKKVDSGGRYANNIGEPVRSKLQFISGYKFSIVFENSEYPGYTTEKIFQAMLAGTIPIYWGNPLIGKEFNTRSFINLYDYATVDEALEAVIRLDTDDARYREMLEQPWFIGDKVPTVLTEEFILGKFKAIFESDPLSPKRRIYYVWQYFMAKSRAARGRLHRASWFPE